MELGKGEELLRQLFLLQQMEILVIHTGGVTVTQGFITEKFNALNLPSGQWTINQEVQLLEIETQQEDLFTFLFKVA
jgi:hypothetical protein